MGMAVSTWSMDVSQLIAYNGSLAEVSGDVAGSKGRHSSQRCELRFH